MVSVVDAVIDPTFRPAASPRISNIALSSCWKPPRRNAVGLILLCTILLCFCKYLTPLLSSFLCIECEELNAFLFWTTSHFHFLHRVVVYLLARIVLERIGYNFCDGIFIGCSNFPGEFIDYCNGVVVSGCNQASAVEPEPLSGAMVPSISLFALKSLISLSMWLALF